MVYKVSLVSFSILFTTLELSTHRQGNSNNSRVQRYDECHQAERANSAVEPQPSRFARLGSIIICILLELSRSIAVTALAAKHILANNLRAPVGVCPGHSQRLQCRREVYVCKLFLQRAMTWIRRLVHDRLNEYTKMRRYSPSFHLDSPENARGDPYLSTTSVFHIYLLQADY